MNIFLTLLFTTVSSFGLNLDCDKVKINLTDKGDSAVFMAATFANGTKRSGYVTETVKKDGTALFELNNLVLVKKDNTYSLPLQNLNCL